MLLRKQTTYDNYKIVLFNCIVCMEYYINYTKNDVVGHCYSNNIPSYPQASLLLYYIYNVVTVVTVVPI